MDTYDTAAQAASKQVTETFSDSFSTASRLFAPAIRPHIYNIYGMVRLADEIADSYTGSDAMQLLDDLESETVRAITRGFSSNLVLHAFQLTANRFGIDRELIEPFYASMRTDLRRDYTPEQYQDYIYGSAEVVGLMCLRVFVNADDTRYADLEPGARALGSAFQKVNFLRDVADDNTRLGRYYFPVGSYETFDEAIRDTVISDIRQEFTTAEPAVRQLPKSCRSAVLTAYRYYNALLTAIAKTPAAELKQRRVRIPYRRKLMILSSTVAGEKLRG